MWLPFYVRLGIVEGDLASQQSSPLQSCNARLYLWIRRCLAKPLYCPVFYVKEKAALAPVAALALCLPVHPPVSHCLAHSSFSHLWMCHLLLLFSLLFVFIYLLSSFLIAYHTFFNLSSAIFSLYLHCLTN